MSSKAALSILVKAVSSCALVPLVLHMDATYKLNSNEYPVLILGLSDAQQQFHLLSISVLSHHTEAVYREVLRVFKRVIEHVLPEIRFSPQYVVTDCDAAERYSEMWYISSYVSCFSYQAGYAFNINLVFLMSHSALSDNQSFVPNINSSTSSDAK